MNTLESQLTTLTEIAHNPAAQLNGFVADGKKVVGCFPEYAPEELVYALGMVPFGIWGSEGKEISEAKRYFPPFYCALALSSLEMGLRGELNKLSAVMIPILCDTLKCLGQNWKVGVPDIPFIQIKHPQNRKIEAGMTFLTKEYRRIGERLSEIAGTELTEQALAKAITLYNEHRAVMREFSEVAGRYPHLISPAQRNDVIKSGYFMLKPAHTAAVKAIIALCRQEAETPWQGHKVVVAGIIADSRELLSMFADNRMAIVADEVAHESRQFRTDVPVDADPFRAMALQLSDMDGCSLLFDPEKQRGAHLVDLVKKHDADGVIYLLTKFCDPEEFDLPIVRKEMEKAGIPFIAIEVDQQTQSYEQARTALQTFADVMVAN